MTAHHTTPDHDHVTDGRACPCSPQRTSYGVDGYRTSPDQGGDLVLVEPSRYTPGLVITVGGRDGASAAGVAPVERVPLAQAVAGDEYVVVKRAVIDRVRAHCHFVTEAGAATMYQGGAYDVATEVLTALDGER